MCHGWLSLVFIIDIPVMMSRTNLETNSKILVQDTSILPNLCERIVFFSAFCTHTTKCLQDLTIHITQARNVIGQSPITLDGACAEGE